MPCKTPCYSVKHLQRQEAMLWVGLLARKCVMLVGKALYRTLHLESRF